MTCPCAPADASFTDKYKAISGGSAPGTYSTEGYDAVNIFLQAVAAGKSTREDMLAWVNAYDAKGIAKQIKFQESGELSEVAIYATRSRTARSCRARRSRDAIVGPNDTAGRRPNRAPVRPSAQVDTCFCLSISSS